ncbi:hypothetical protein ACIP98_03035 [Streptomyces sp. NPDC088354]|uniref:hypothetical protein n=1 Tax=unclassified Streptomyces TaxID=2593676 RepID=UPI0029A6C0E9|nr:hypothetical protein [Streptomyces sp. MI02-7b]MDX3076103.1 hypothetical protein [Streptomyces sp. MI02-7b]
MDTGTAPDGPPSDAEFEQYRDLLPRYCAHELGQWENLMAETPAGPASVISSRALPPGAGVEARRPFSRAVAGPAEANDH